LVVRVTQTGALTATASTQALLPDPNPADNSTTVLANQPLPPAPAPFTPPAAAPKPVIGPPVSTPVHLLAGKPALVTFAVTRNDTHARVTSGHLTCDATFRGKAILHVARLTRGVATVRFTVPAAARGGVVRLRMTMKLGGVSTTRTALLRVG
jgi:hypothetical protein